MYKLTSQTYTATKHDDRLHDGWLAACVHAFFFLSLFFFLYYCTAKASSATLKHCVELLASGLRAFLFLSLRLTHSPACLPTLKWNGNNDDTWR